MTVDYINNDQIVPGDGATTSFNFSPLVLTQASDLVLTLWDTLTNALTELTIDVDFTLTPAGTYPNTFSVTYPISGSAIPSTSKLIAQCIVPLTQNAKLRNQTGYFANVQEELFDKMVRINQQLQAQIDRAPKVPISGFAGQAGGVVVVNDAEDAFEVRTGLTGSQGAAGVPGAAGPIGPWSFVETIDLAGLASKAFSSVGSGTGIALMMMIHGVVVSNNGAAWGPQIDYGSGILTAYKRANAEVDETNVLAGNGNTGAAILPAFAIAQGNTSPDAGSAWAIIHDPFTNGTQKFVTGHIAYKDSTNLLKSGTFSAVANASPTTPIVGLQIITNAGTFISGKVHLFELKASALQSSYPVSDYRPGIPSASEVVLSHVFPFAVDLGVDFAGAQAVADANATADTIFDVQIGGLSVGSVTYLAGTKVGVFSSSGVDISTVAADHLTVVAPATPDATLSGPSFTFYGKSAG